MVNVEKIIDIHYIEFSKDFCFSGGRHEYWDMVYVDKGIISCKSDKSRFVLRSGEMSFHKPGEQISLMGDNNTAPNVSIMTFACKSRMMQKLEGKIFRLDREQKNLLSMLFEEGLFCNKADAKEKVPLGSGQMTKNLLEVFLIKMCRSTDVIAKQMRRSHFIDEVGAPHNIRDILAYLHENVYGKITVGDIARRVGKSESTVKQLFLQYRPNGIINYYNSLKIGEAKKLIREEGHNMAQISDMLGFDNPQYFSKCFKKFTKMTPGEYKKSIIK